MKIRPCPRLWGRAFKSLPFFGAMVVALMVITYIPATSLWLPVQTKQLKQAEVEKSSFMQTKIAQEESEQR